MQFLKSFAVNKCDFQLTRLHPRLTELIACLKSRYKEQISKFPPMNCTTIHNYAHNVIIRHVTEGQNNLVVRGQITWFTTIRASQLSTQLKTRSTPVLRSSELRAFKLAKNVSKPLTVVIFNEQLYSREEMLESLIRQGIQWYCYSIQYGLSKEIMPAILHVIRQCTKLEHVIKIVKRKQYNKNFQFYTNTMEDE